jgi:hypothetical protein
MTDLSSAAQAVDHAIAARIYLLGEIAPSKQVAAAAIRALADQVVPVEVHPEVYKDCCQYSDVKTRAGIRAAILAIATELEGHE